MEVTKQNIEKIVSDAVLTGNMNISIFDKQHCDLLFTSKSNYKMFGVDESIPHNKLIEYWLENIVHKDCYKEQKAIFESGKVPKTRKYKINHPQKGERLIRVDISDPVAIYGKNLSLSFFYDITD